MNNVFVYCEIEGTTVKDVALRLLTKSSKLANTLGVQLECIIAGSGLDGVENQVMKYGVDKVHVFDAEGLFLTPPILTPHLWSISSRRSSHRYASSVPLSSDATSVRVSLLHCSAV